MKEKIQQAIADMSLKVCRSSKHIYTNNETGIRLQGVSSVSSIVPKDWLSAWGAKECAKALGYSDYPDTSIAEEVWKKIKGCKNVEEYLGIIKEAKGASARKSKQALVDGKAGHAWIEKYIKAKIDNMVVPPILNGSLERPLKQFLEWEEREVDYWIASEAIICRLDKSYGGQLDGVYMSKKGEVCLSDFKFASVISEDYYLQTAGYQATFEPYGIKFDRRVIIRLPKTLERDEWNEKKHKYEKVLNDIEVRDVPTSYEADREAFFHALLLKGWINYVINFNK